MSHVHEALFDLHEIAGPGMLKRVEWRHYNGGAGGEPISAAVIRSAVAAFPDVIFNVRLVQNVDD